MRVGALKFALTCSFLGDDPKPLSDVSAGCQSGVRICHYTI